MMTPASITPKRAADLNARRDASRLACRRRLEALVVEAVARGDEDAADFWSELLGDCRRRDLDRFFG